MIVARSGDQYAVEDGPDQVVIVDVSKGTAGLPVPRTTIMGDGFQPVYLPPSVEDALLRTMRPSPDLAFVRKALGPPGNRIADEYVERMAARLADLPTDRWDAVFGAWTGDDDAALDALVSDTPMSRVRVKGDKPHHRFRGNQHTGGIADSGEDAERKPRVQGNTRQGVRIAQHGSPGIKARPVGVPTNLSGGSRFPKGQPMVAPWTPEGEQARKTSYEDVTVGDLGERLATAHGDFRSLMPGSRRQNPFDLQYDNSRYVVELKTMWTSRGAYKARHAAKTYADRAAYCKRFGLTPATMVLVINKGERRARAYMKRGFGGFRLNHKNPRGWTYLGEWPT